ncbi:chemotaxis protein CheD [Lentibacillus sediminis]|uniref:chemotaxis protein CheD n=1 Tax=Lentibacillus sediminis TaxID=1940529 RepID=UPI000C1C6455|nr:chemotaxis protein CheD [Lentibacillus sediminis]
MKDKHIIKVGISSAAIAHSPDLLRTTGLGSCVGVVLYDEANERAGLAHILLPDSSLAKSEPIHIFKYADSSIPWLIDRLTAAGANRNALKAKIAGGAQMFPSFSGSDTIRIGERNIEAVSHLLKKAAITVTGSDVGGVTGRTIEFNPQTQQLRIRKINEPVIYI